MLHSLDTVVLSHRILEQENLVIELRNRISELEDVMVTTGETIPTEIMLTYFRFTFLSPFLYFT